MLPIYTCKSSIILATTWQPATKGTIWSAQNSNQRLIISQGYKPIRAIKLIIHGRKYKYYTS